MNIYGFKPIIKNKIGNFRSGIKMFNDQYYYVDFKETAKQNFEDADVFVQFNIFNPYLTYNRLTKKYAYEYILNSNKPFLVCEEGAFRQFPNYKRFGWYNYKNNSGNFLNQDVNDTRWKNFKKQNNLEIKEWKSHGDYILIMAQIEYDSALIEMYNQGYKNFLDYSIKLIEEIRKHTDRPIVFRPHPKDTVKDFSLLLNLPNVKISQNFSAADDFTKNGGVGLQKDFDRAHCVVTFNSNSSVEAVCNGLPVFSLDKTSPTYEISHTSLAEIENIKYDIDIKEWCNKIAYTVWNEEEISNGTMWSHLRNINEQKR